MCKEWVVKWKYYSGEILNIKKDLCSHELHQQKNQKTEMTKQVNGMKGSVEIVSPMENNANSENNFLNVNQTDP